METILFLSIWVIVFKFMDSVPLYKYLWGLTFCQALCQMLAKHRYIRPGNCPEGSDYRIRWQSCTTECRGGPRSAIHHYPQNYEDRTHQGEMLVFVLYDTTRHRISVFFLRQYSSTELWIQPLWQAPSNGFNCWFHNVGSLATKHSAKHSFPKSVLPTAWGVAFVIKENNTHVIKE